MIVAPTTATVLAAENQRLRKALEGAEERARLAEEQLLRVHRAVRAAQQNLKNARERRDEILNAAQQHASQLVREAEHEAERISRAASLAAESTAAEAAAETPAPSGFASLIGSRAHDWAENDPTLDERLELYLENDLEPDESREWILGERGN